MAQVRPANEAPEAWTAQVMALKGQTPRAYLDRAEMRDMREEIIRMLQAPAEVRISRSDSAVRLFYEFYSRTTLP